MVENNITQTSNLIETVDSETRKRCGALAARSLLDNQIADILLLTVEQVVAIRATDEFKVKYAEEANQAIQDAFDRDEGWDAIETQSLAILMETMKFNRDPKFALLAARTANMAERRSKQKQNAPKVVETPGGGGQTTNIVYLQINKTYAERPAGMIDISPNDPKQIPLKQSDVPSPKLVDEMLQPAREKAGLVSKDAKETDLERMFRESGVVFDGEE